MTYAPAIEPCNFCGATGEVWHHSEPKLAPCPVCGGLKVIPKENNVTPPAGAHEAQSEA